MATSPEELDDADLEEPDFVDDEDDDIPLDEPDDEPDEDDEETAAEGEGPEGEPDATTDDAEKPLDGAGEPAKTGDVPPAAQGAAPDVGDGLESFRFSAEQKPYEVSGSYKTEDGGYYFPPASVAQVQQLMASGMHAPAYISRANRRIQELEQKAKEPSEAEHKAKAILTHFAGLIDQGPEKVAEWLDNLKGNWSTLTLEYERDAAKRRAEALEAQQTSRTAESDGEVVEEQIATTLEKELYTLNRELAGGGYTDDDLVPLFQQIHEFRGSAFGRMPDGRLGVDRPRIRAAFERFMSWRGAPKVAAPNGGKLPPKGALPAKAPPPAADRRGRGPTTPPPKPMPAGRKDATSAAAAHARDVEGRTADDTKAQWWRRRPPKNQEESDRFFALPSDVQIKYSRKWPSRW